MFLGEYRHSIDAKGRVSLPARFRAALKSPLVLAKGLDKELLVYTSEDYEAFLEEVVSRDQFKNKAREVRRWYTANAMELDLDKAGRLNVPAGYAAYAGIEGEAYVIGSGDHVEIWSVTAWAEYQDRMSNIADTAEEIADLGAY